MSVVQTVLKIKDQMSEPLIKIGKTVGKTERQMKKSTNQMKKWRNTSVKAIDDVVKKSVKLSATMGAAVLGVGTKMGFTEAMDMEGYRVQLITAVKDTEKAGKLMAEAVAFANKTPFETGSVVEATAKMEAYGISSRRWLSDVADMAGATNKSIDQATEAMADAVMGEWERLKEFGIKKEMLVAAAAKKYGEDVVFNKKGQVTDQIKMQEILQETMQKKFKGGADKLSKTTKGLWSTVTGVTKSSLAKIVGMQEDGTIKQGSLYEKLKIQIERVADSLLKWQKDGTITRIAEQVTGAVMQMVKGMQTVFNFVDKYKGIIVLMGTLIGSVYLGIKAYTSYIAILKFVTTAQAILNGTMMVNPVGLVVAGIVGLVAAGVLLYKNWDIIVESLKHAWEWFKNLGMQFIDITLQITGLGDVIGFVVDKFKALTSTAGKAFGVVKKIFGLGGKDTNINVNTPTAVPDMDLYAGGGIANKPSIFGEAGPEIAIPLNGSQRSKELLGKANNIVGGSTNNSTINVTITGDIYGFADFKERVAEAFVKIMEQGNPNVARGV